MSLLTKAEDLVNSTLYRIQAPYRRPPTDIRPAVPRSARNCVRCIHSGDDRGRMFGHCKATGLVVHREDVCKRFAGDDGPPAPPPAPKRSAADFDAVLGCGRSGSG